MVTLYFSKITLFIYFVLPPVLTFNSRHTSQFSVFEDPPQSIMDMHGMTMSATSTASAAMASSTGMDMSGMGMGNDCKISVRLIPPDSLLYIFKLAHTHDQMLWNWYTVDACTQPYNPSTQAHKLTDPQASSPNHGT